MRRTGVRSAGVRGQRSGIGEGMAIAALMLSTFFTLAASPASAQDASTAAPPSAGQATPPAAQDASSGVPRLVKFSGLVKDSTGKVQAGVVALTFSLYEQQEGGAPLWVESQSIQLDDQGRYTVLLGATQAEGLPLDLFTSGKARWLGVEPQLPGEGEQPRVLLVGVPYALKAADADTLGGKPASAFVTTDVQAGASGQGKSATSSANSQASNQAATVGATAVLQTQVPTATIGGSGTTNFIPIWTNSTTLGNSTLFQTGGNVGIGNIIPAGKLDVSGGAFIRGTLQLPATATATAGSGFNSQPMDLLRLSTARLLRQLINISAGRPSRWETTLHRRPEN